MVAPREREREPWRDCPATEITVSGGYSVEATPDPIPNSEVKLYSADGTAGTSLWESKSSPEIMGPEGGDLSGPFFCLFFTI